MHDDIRVHLVTLVVHIRNLMARLSHPSVLESRIVDIPFHIRHQRLHTHQYDGCYIKRRIARIPCLVDTDRRVFLPYFLPLPKSNPVKPETRLEASA